VSETSQDISPPGHSPYPNHKPNPNSNPNTNPNPNLTDPTLSLTLLTPLLTLNHNRGGNVRGGIAQGDCPFAEVHTTMCCPNGTVTLLARRSVLPPGELRCAAVECYRRRQTPASKTILAPCTMCRRASNKQVLALLCAVTGVCEAAGQLAAALCKL